MISILLTDDMLVPSHYPVSINKFKALGKSSLSLSDKSLLSVNIIVVLNQNLDK